MTRKLARRRLDARLSHFRENEAGSVPSTGWVRAIRDALGMSSSQLARRMGVSPQAVTGPEQSEVSGTTSLNTLRRVAAALDATLVYAIVPNATLESMVENKAKSIARVAVMSVNHTMMLEGQGTGTDALEEAIETYAEGLRDRELWQD
ncbi:mobile mystery protein A (plasmid) [Devosia sp. A8/3-2]|nr:mobile mystery protein A [Devosia sp. A8/3-2]